MIGKLVRGLLGFLLVNALTIAALAWVLSLTLLDAQNLSRSLGQPGVAAAAVEAVGQSVPNIDQATLKKTLTPQLVKEQIDALVPQLVEHFTNGGVVVMDLRDIGQSLAAAQSKVSLVDLPEVFVRVQHLDLSRADRQIRPAAAAVTAAKTWAPAAAVVLLVLLFIIAGHHRFRSLAKAFAAAAVMTAAAAGLVWLPVWLASLVLSGGEAGAIFGPLVHATTAAVAAAQSRLLLYAAAGFFITAVVCLVIHPLAAGAHRLSGRRHK